jgi:hypothetical protein
VGTVRENLERFDRSLSVRFCARALSGLAHPHTHSRPPFSSPCSSPSHAQPWYAGNVSREVTEERLRAFQAERNFVVAHSDNSKAYRLSVRLLQNPTRVDHFLIFHLLEGFRLDLKHPPQPHFRAVVELVHHYLRCPQDMGEHAIFSMTRSDHSERVPGEQMGSAAVCARCKGACPPSSSLCPKCAGRRACPSCRHANSSSESKSKWEWRIVLCCVF